MGIPIAAFFCRLALAALMAKSSRDRVHNAVCETCRVLMSRGITGQFETWKVDPCITGDITSMAELTVHEPADGLVQFARWRPFAQNAFSRSPILSANARGEWGEGGVAIIPVKLYNPHRLLYLRER